MFDTCTIEQFLFFYRSGATRFFMSIEIGAKTPQAIGIFENGEARSDLHFSGLPVDDGYLGFAEDDLYQYEAHTSDKICNGTIFVRNTKTGDIKAVPVSTFMEIRRTIKISQEISKGEDPKTQELIQQFGTRAAQRLIKQRNSGGQ